MKGSENNENGSMGLKKLQKIRLLCSRQNNHVILGMYDAFERGAI